MGRKTQISPPTEGPEADEYHLDPPVDGDVIRLDEGFEEWMESHFREEKDDA